MVMQCYKLAFATGCVGAVKVTAKQTHLVMYVDPVEIRKLNQYFASPSARRAGRTIAEDILSDGADFGAASYSTSIGPCAIARPTQIGKTHRVFRIRKRGKRPSEVKKFPHLMEDGWYYWARKK